MKPVLREELLDWQTWSDRRAERLSGFIDEKEARRVHLGDSITFLFENHGTVLFQVQEMMRVERIVREAEIQHELDTYNELLGGPGELGATMLIEIDDPVRRAEVLPRWHGLPEHIYAVLPDGRRVAARFDERQRDERRISTVQFVKFPVGGVVPVALGVDHAELSVETRLTKVQRAALAADLAG